MKTYTITPVPGVSLLRVTSTYLAGFGGLWLFVEPLGAFGLLPALNTAPAIFLYSLLVLVPALVVPVVLRWHGWYKSHSLPFVRLSVRSAADGATYSLKVAQNMQVSEVLRQYVNILRRGPARSRVEATTDRYYPVLQVKRNGVFIDVNGNSTVHTAGLQEGDECQVRAQEYEHLNEVMFSRTAR